MLELAIKITLAHLLGDFVFQSDKMVNDINTKKLRSGYLYLHILIHLTLLLAVTQFEQDYVIPVILLSVSHLAIDMLTKIWIKNRINKVYNMILDQALHAIALAVFVKYYFDYTIAFDLIFSTANYLLIAALACTTYVSAIVMKKIMELFNYPLPNKGIKDAGKYIGMLERLFIFAFVVCSFYEGIGFLLAAKSIFRFGDLKQHKEIKLTEYILIGTLLSFGIAMLIGHLYLIVKAAL